MSFDCSREEPPLLSILIPTYNRAWHLEQLLREIRPQLSECPQESIEIIISDNCSTDETSLICKEAAASVPSIRYIWQSHNIGPDQNFLQLIGRATGMYFWLLGDDDLPRRGLLPLLIKLLTGENPDLLYLPSIWRPNICPSDLDPIFSLSFEKANPVEFARKHHIWTTFISAWIVNRNTLHSSGITLDALALGAGSYFIQLGWILPLLVNKNHKLYSLAEPSVLATSSNERGSHFLKTFSINYPDEVVRLAGFATATSRSLITPFLATYLPALILNIRLSRLGEPVNIWPYLLPMIKRLWSYLGFWIYCFPVLFIPSPLIPFLHKQAKRFRAG